MRLLNAASFCLSFFSRRWRARFWTNPERGSTARCYRGGRKSTSRNNMHIPAQEETSRIWQRSKVGQEYVTSPASLSRCTSSQNFCNLSFLCSFLSAVCDLDATNLVAPKLAAVRLARGWAVETRLCDLVVLRLDIRVDAWASLRLRICTHKAM